MVVSLAPKSSQPSTVIQFCVVSVLREASWHHDDFSIEFLLGGTRKASGREGILELNVIHKKENGDIPAIGNRMGKGTQEEMRREKRSGARS